MKIETTFVRMHSGDHLRDAKMSKKGTSLRRIVTFLFCFDRHSRWLEIFTQLSSFSSFY